ncbi:hypothetical protein F2Q68_00020588 [Brassica cretica]|uniref:Uncharacterized protein n=1 Tax=Brassica cretica TaxID=69181 RepID=A0A8S9FQW3_BRACR|nr:hypothetical protein F2Q68_00020588 [Brassica cretica]
MRSGGDHVDQDADLALDKLEEQVYAICEDKVRGAYHSYSRGEEAQVEGDKTGSCSRGSLVDASEHDASLIIYSAATMVVS